MAMLPVQRSGRNLTVVNPSREFEDIYDRMGQLMNLAFGLAPVDVAEGPWIPLADVSETDDAYVVEVDLPGANRDQIDIQVQDRELVITGEIPESEQEGRRLLWLSGPVGADPAAGAVRDRGDVPGTWAQ